MDQVHRNIIISNHCFLLTEVNWPALVPRLIKNGIFSKSSMAQYDNYDSYDCKVNILFAMPGMGPEAFDKFILSLRESSQVRVINKLLGVAEPSPPPRSHAVPIYPENMSRPTPIDLRTEKLRINVIPSETFMDDFSQLLNPYTMRSRSRGAVLIINNKTFLADPPRKGAQIDQENLEELFEQMGGYNVTIKENRTALQMQNDIINFSKSNVLKTVDIMFLIIMSHGSAYVNESQVKCVDEEFVRTSWIESQFLGDACPNMQNKPKVIVYQICRGSDLDNGVRKVETDGLGIDIPTRKHSDMLICHSTSQGYKAHRDTELGSWYIQYLCETFMQYAHSHHIETMLHLVDDHLSILQSDNVDKTMQTPNFYNMGFRLCFLNPGIYEENKQLCRYSD
ncbi:caspase [Holotrichia oblita]|uniref:Caspase n=1 Tax=Holotrichia oblita TaxID=644536 RepID=A0ACB9T547_HOLOL|nr:caspase [Holotrichia oblita]